jgi:2-polyprenyl-3-methyl-5-hydroxy-6-metoxy-1,4-benzoquinol methylase
MKFYLDTEYPVALDSLDHVYPLGTALDNTINLDFNKKVYALYPGKTISILDLGCAGGGMIKTFADDGHTAIGLEGSNYNLVNQRASWATNPDNFLTCDCSRPFTLHNGNGEPYQFDIITAWEFLEHIYEYRLQTLFLNVKRHLKADGLFLGSTTNSDPNSGGIHHHVTRYMVSWWREKMRDNGLIRDRSMEYYFDKSWVRSWTSNNFVCRRVTDERNI